MEGQERTIHIHNTKYDYLHCFIFYFFHKQSNNCSITQNWLIYLNIFILQVNRRFPKRLGRDFVFKLFTKEKKTKVK